MSEPWITLECPECGEDWEENPADLPATDEEFTCDHCSAVRPTAEFAETNRDLEILQDFH